MRSDGRTLLRRLVNERRLTREELLQRLRRRAAQLGIDRFTIELRQLDRWLSGAVKGLPHPAACRVLEAEFGLPVERLLSFDPVPEQEPLDTGQPASETALEVLRLRLVEMTAELREEIDHALAQHRRPATHPSAPTPATLERIVVRACQEAGVNASGLQPLAGPTSPRFLLPEESLVARVVHGPGATVRSRISVLVTGQLAQQGVPVVEPVAVPSGRTAPIVVAGPDDVAVTFWRHYRPAGAPVAPPPAQLARLVRALHGLPPPPGPPLPTYRPLAELSDTLTDPVGSEVLGPGTHGWLQGMVARLQARYERLRFPLGVGLIHASLHTGDLAWDGERLLLGGWDSACIGPREVDLVPIFAGHPRFGLGTSQVDQFADGYGWDLRRWRGFDTLRTISDLAVLPPLIRLSESSKEAATELTLRLGTLWDTYRTVR